MLLEQLFLHMNVELLYNGAVYRLFSSVYLHAAVRAASLEQAMSPAVRMTSASVYATSSSCSDSWRPLTPSTAHMALTPRSSLHSAVAVIEIEMIHLVISRGTRTVAAQAQPSGNLLVVAIRCCALQCNEEALSMRSM